VLASLHARSTELGLQKMARLLGNSDAQLQALASALRGVLCQALLPSVEGERYHLATECLTSNPEVVRMIESGRLGEVRTLMDGGTGKFNAGCHSMNSALVNLLREKKIGMQDARNATTDRIGFADACYAGMIQPE
ncbi:MAG: twitching motility protein, partial [Gammaproteobacteria bacterium]